ncbi:MAG: internalin, partial [Acidobacteriota bacterium]|nr:internalin [Acidobacteriota bacterium]
MAPVTFVIFKRGDTMSNDMDIIRQIEKQTGEKLKPVPHEEIWRENYYALDKNTGQVQMLNLVGRNIKDISFISGLSGLTHLYLGKNQLTDITPLSTLTNLTELYLSYNHIKDLTPLSPLTKLTNLGLNDNKITDLTPLRTLTNLNFLDLCNNCIQQLPPEITSWWPYMEIKWITDYLSGLILCGNPLTDPPIEIVKQSNAAIENFFAEIQRASVLFLESKLLLVGSGDVGKTTLMKKLKDNAFVVIPGTEDTTRGIDIQPWELSCPFPDGLIRDVSIHFWDFGGQDILHATHQIFLTKRSLYLFVWDPRKEE